MAPAPCAECTGAPGATILTISKRGRRRAPEAGTIEVGHICLSRGLQRTRAATEAIHLLAHWAFGAGYRRFEWKCDALNRPSRRAAERFGFSYEGVFRQATVQHRVMVQAVASLALLPLLT